MTRRRKVLIGVAAATLAAAGAVTAVSLVGDHAMPSTYEQTGGPQALGDVTRGDLNAAVRAQGRLAYAGSRKVNAGQGGVLTWLPKAGAQVGRGEKLYEVDARGVYLMYGDKPMYRVMKPGDKGEDVRQLKQNLKALGYGNQLTADTTYTPGTALAVNEWQKDRGLKQTGTISAAQMVFAPDSLRVGTQQAALGDRLEPGKQVYTASGAQRIVEVDLKESDAGQRKVGDKVSVQLPDGTKTDGKISSVGDPAAGQEPGQGPGGDGSGGQDSGGNGSGGSKDSKIKVTIEFAPPGEAKGADQAPVTVFMNGEHRTDVLSVPVEALIALPGKGFGVQAIEDGKVRDVPVQLGLFADGRVEITGKGINEGIKVVIPK
ncbi:efflux RND transporter periplasmic adaptor subunit [Streptomyces sp. WZ-12]|uniref:efflux RND transporter periplasmic adaptor subunit n=1 Tax=Streptomyces sp. WZ-12 TaxID=3030210 RepID=UPI002380D11A|nr:peptidoglycan-binding protein [Streptomyces sp. WZ-12]